MAQNIKEEAFRLVDRLPDSAGWDELMEQIWIRQSIEAGIADSDAGRTTPVEQIREAYGLPILSVFHGAQRPPFAAG